ncbi:N-acetyltransferase [Sphingobium sp. BS19]|nr:N-acetyltransferase [Sphingobium sp. BS19]
MTDGEERCHCAAMTDAPTLHTERLTLRAHRLSDLDDSVALWQDPVTVKFITGGQIQDEQAVWFRILRHAGLWSLFGYGSWVVADRKTGAYVGSAGLLESRRGIPELEGCPEIGWAVRSQLAGQGLATEAVAATLAWADVHVDAPATRCIVDPDNRPSIKVAEKCGFHETARVRNGEIPLILFERNRGG